MNRAINKVMMLDHDGVCCLQSNWGTRFKKKGATGTIDDEFDQFDPKAIKIVNKIIEETDCEIVVSSDWKHFCTLAQMQDLYRIRGIIKSPIDFTAGSIGREHKFFNQETDLEETRCYEIKLWLHAHPLVTCWVAVDDMDLSEHFNIETKEYEWGLKNFVRTPKSNEGIKQSGIKEKIINFLN